MANVRLTEIPGYLPPGEIGSLDRYVSEKIQKGADWLGVLNEIVASERRDSIQESGFAPYVSTLTNQLAATATDERKSRACTGLADTALTNLFADRYNVAINELTKNGLYTLRMHAATHPDNSFSLDYQFTTPQTDEKCGRAWSFWQLGGYATYGFINMSCVGEIRPLEGKGNIAHVPGVEEALAADINTLVNTGI
ncbi:MAG TPA: hypothetical protein VLG11_01350 [Candidatus Saccharimonadales bacterium]|nr:hypothetical protein [Candidatus Saccharimonadales bacterium]